VKELLKLDSICQSYVQIKNVPVFWLCVYSWRDIGKPDVCLWTAYYRNAFAVVHKSILIQKTFHFFHFTVTANVDNFYIWCILYRVILQNNYWLIYIVSTATQPWVKLICCFGISFAQINTVSAHQMSEPLQRQIPKFILPPPGFMALSQSRWLSNMGHHAWSRVSDASLAALRQCLTLGMAYRKALWMVLFTNGVRDFRPAWMKIQSILNTCCDI